MIMNEWIRSGIPALTLIVVIVSSILTYLTIGDLRSDIVELKVDVGILKDRSNRGGSIDSSKSTEPSS
ncbi:MAG: hypothetical protein ISN28_12145 [Ectothiorhodospiraceae bacterium AqS1]|nr:hypothetical protein [Ectothiorhodospiraceae bacterium AqS1]